MTQTGTQAMKDYIIYSYRPFTSNQIVAELGLCYETVKKYLQDFLAEGFIKLIGKDKGKNVFIFNKYRDNPKTYTVTRQKHYTLESVQETYRRQLKNRREEFSDYLEAL